MLMFCDADIEGPLERTRCQSCGIRGPRECVVMYGRHRECPVFHNAARSQGPVSDLHLPTGPGSQLLTHLLKQDSKVSVLPFKEISAPLYFDIINTSQ